MDMEELKEKIHKLFGRHVVVVRLVNWVDDFMASKTDKVIDND